MDYEKAYKEALERARAIHNEKQAQCYDIMAKVFPELAESEDERIRKKIIEFAKNLKGWVESGRTTIAIRQDDIDMCDRWIAYLEKRKERGPLTKEEEYTLQRIIERLADEGCPQSWKDLLYNIYNLPYEKQKEQKPAEWNNVTINGEPIPTENQSVNIPLPEWSEEDDERLDAVINFLFVLDSYIGDDCTISDDKTTEARDAIQKVIVPWLKDLPNRFVPHSIQEWSEEDEKSLKLCEWFLRDFNSIDATRVKLWLKSLKDKVVPQKQEWSKEDERMLSRCVKSIETSKQFADSNTFKEAKDKEISWLKSLPERFNLQPKQEWSEGDERILKGVIGKIDHDQTYGVSKVEMLSFLKSLHPQPHWKPSEEQMDALKTILCMGGFSYVGQATKLQELYIELKKL